MNRVWFEGKLEQGNLSISAQDRGLTLGDGVFETIAVTGGIALWLEDHLQRMRQSAIEIGLPFPETHMAHAIHELTREADGHHVLRLTLTRGVGERGLSSDATSPTFIGTLLPFDQGLRFQPTTLMTSSIRRNLQTPTSHMKTLSYVDNILAAREATEQGFEDAVMLNTAGRVACTTIGNLFLVVDGALLTPSLKEGILPGVMRNLVIAQAKRLNVMVREKQVRPQDIAGADALFVTNSLRFMRSVNRCDKKRFTRPSKLLDSLMKALLNAEQEQINLQRG